MKNHPEVLKRVLAVLGTALVWFPLFAPLALSILALISMGRFLFDYLMPAEMFPLALIGGILLLWTARRAQTRQKFIAWGLVTAIGSLVVMQGLAVITGLASGENEAVGWRMALVMAFLVVFWFALIALGVGGILLLRDVFKRRNMAR